MSNNKALPQSEAALANTASAYLDGTPPEHDLTLHGEETLAAQLMRLNGLDIPRLPQFSANDGCSQLQFRSYLLARIGGMPIHLAAAAAGLPTRVVQNHLSKGAKDAALGVEGRFAVFWRMDAVFSGAYAVYLQTRLNHHVAKSDNPRALLHALKGAGFDDRPVVEVEQEQAAMDDVLEGLAASLPKVQT